MSGRSKSRRIVDTILQGESRLHAQDCSPGLGMVWLGRIVPAVKWALEEKRQGKRFIMNCQIKESWNILRDPRDHPAQIPQNPTLASLLSKPSWSWDRLRMSPFPGELLPPSGGKPSLKSILNSLGTPGFAPVLVLFLGDDTGATPQFHILIKFQSGLGKKSRNSTNTP